MQDAPHTFPVRVYYEDTDFSGVVYHASYLRFMERGRTEWLRERGVFHSALYEESAAKGDPIAFVVARMNIDFRRPAKVDDMLSIETRVSKALGASITMEQQVKRGDTVLVVASVIVACVQGGRAQRLPLALRESLGIRIIPEA